MPERNDRSDAMTIVIHLPQPIDKVLAVLRVIGEQWHDTATFSDGLTRLEIPADD